LHVGESIERDEVDVLGPAQLGELGLREDEIGFDRGTEIRVSVTHVRGSKSKGPQLEQPQQLARPAKRARCIRPWIFDSGTALLERRVVGANRNVDFPLPQEVPDIEIEPFAHNL
jgi:hypothetical protein